MIKVVRLVDVCNGDKDRYRFGFNGQEKVNEWAGIGNHLAFEARGYDSRTGRWLSVDPLATMIPGESIYSFAGNNPIYYIDNGGELKVSSEATLAAYRRQYPLVMKYLETQLNADVLKSQKMIRTYAEIRHCTPEMAKRYLNFVTTWGKGPELQFDPAPGWQFGAHGFFDISDNSLTFDATYAASLEKILESNANFQLKQAAFMKFYMTVTHEIAHRFNYPDGIINEEGSNVPVSIKNRHSGGADGEVGYDFENKVWGSLGIKFGNTGIGDVSHYEPGVVEKVIDNAKRSREGIETLPTTPGISNSSSDSNVGQGPTKDEEDAAMYRVDHPGSAVKGR